MRLRLDLQQVDGPLLCRHCFATRDEVAKQATRGTVVSTLAFHLCHPGSIPARSIYQIKILHWPRVSSLTLPNTAGFLLVLRLPPVQTLDQRGMILTGPLWRTV